MVADIIKENEATTFTKTSSIPKVEVHPVQEWPTVYVGYKSQEKWSGVFHTTQKRLNPKRVEYYKNKLLAGEKVYPVDVFVVEKKFGYLMGIIV